MCSLMWLPAYILQMLEKGTVFITNVAPGPVCTDVSKNSLRGDGSLVGVTGELIKKGMPVKRYICSVHACMLLNCMHHAPIFNITPAI